MLSTAKIDPHIAILESALYRPSPHCDDRPPTEIDTIVVHGISLPPGEFGSDAIEKFFCGELHKVPSHPYFATISHLRVSAHLLIKRNGEIIQFVPFSKRAWHAGVSIFKGRTNCNDFSIGIELEGTDQLPYEKIQYEQLATICHLLRDIYPHITQERIVGHADIAPGRKTDPGPSFDWLYLREIITK